MARQALEATLQQLHEQLAETRDLDQAEITKLRAAVEEIEATLDRSDVSSASLADRLREATRDFEESHPVLTGTVGRVADMLAQMGI
jgi:CII-binding regulator of phage lambda lysogenization HflD